MIVDYQKARLVEDFSKLLDSVNSLQCSNNEVWVGDLLRYSQQVCTIVLAYLNSTLQSQDIEVWRSVHIEKALRDIDAYILAQRMVDIHEEIVFIRKIQNAPDVPEELWLRKLKELVESLRRTIVNRNLLKKVA